MEQGDGTHGRSEVRMESLIISAVVFAVIFAGGAIGMELQHALPESYTTGGPRDFTGAVVGLVTLLLALVLGLLIWTAYGVFSAQRASTQTMAISALKFDEALQAYGPDAQEGREILKSAMKGAIAQIWGVRDDSDFVIRNFSATVSNLKNQEAFLDTLHPTTDEEKTAKADASQASVVIGQTRTQMAVSLIDPISYPLLGVVVAWGAFLFCGYGLLSRRHLMSYIVLAVGAMAVASSIYVISDLISPYSGLFQVSPEPILDALQAADEAAAPSGAHR
jgi:hypothetical protein